MTNKHNDIFYTGITGHIVLRVEQHKAKVVEGFTKKYNLTKCVYIEKYDFVIDAISREKTIKRWKRNWKINLVSSQNPTWKDLSLEFSKLNDN